MRKGGGACSKECIFKMGALRGFSAVVLWAIFLGGLRKTVDEVLLLLWLVTIGTTTGIGRQDAEKALFVTRSSPIVRTMGVVLPLP
jgi:hypothetical protein